MSDHAANDATKQPEEEHNIISMGAPSNFAQGLSEVKRGFGVRVHQVLERMGLARLMGLSFDGKRDIWSAFGWDRQLSVEMIMDMYLRGGIPKRIVDAKPDSTWGRPPRVYLPPQVQPQPAPTSGQPPQPQPQLAVPNGPPAANPTPPPQQATIPNQTAPVDPNDPNLQWTKAFYKLAWDLDLWTHMKRVDILAGLGRYAILVIGTNRGSLSQPLPTGGAGALKITYLQPYGETQARIDAYDKDPTSPRFGLPTMYTILNSNIRQLNTTGTMEMDVRPEGASYQVHHSRVIHVTRNGLTNCVFGIPEFAPIWNYLCDLLKVVGASSESYWRVAYPGLHADVDKDMDMDEEDETNLTAEMDEFQHDMRRFLRTRGVTVKDIGSKVADPRGAFDVLVTLISGTTGIPKRILLGSEAGQLASSQDKANWAERIEEYRENHAEPNLIWPFVMWTINSNIVPLPANADIQMMRCLWPDAYRMSPLERSQTAAQTARSLANIAKGLQPVTLIPEVPAVPAIPATPASQDPITGDPIPGKPGSPGSPGVPAVLAEPLLNRDEARRILGLSTDQNLLAQFPEELG
jgi:hypothetical protein